MSIYELTPTDGRKSFYGKARVIIDVYGDETLISYTTPVIKKTASGELIRLWAGWSATTGCHIVAFAGIGKRAFMALPVTVTPADKAAAYSGTLYY